jgi:hypothetical protein
MHGGVGAPGAPGFGALRELFFRAVGGFAKDEVAGGEGVGVGEGAHGVVGAGPGADAGDAFEALVAVEYGAGVGAEGLLAGGGQAETSGSAESPS